MRRPPVASPDHRTGVMMGVAVGALTAVVCFLLLPRAAEAQSKAAGQPLAQVLTAIEAGQLQDAETLLRRHLDSGRQAPAVHFLLGEVLLQQHRAHAAEASLRRAVEGRGDRPLWLHRLAVSLAQQGQCQAALPFLERAIHLQTTPQRLYDRALCRLAGGHFEAAADDFRAVVSSQPTHARAWFELGQLTRNQGHDQQAAAYYLHKALEADGNFLAARYQLALVDLTLHRQDAAIAGLRQVLQRLPGHGGATYNLGRALMATEDDAARQEGREMLLTFRQLSRQEDLLDNHLQALQMNPSDVDTRLDTGRLLLGLGRLKEAIEQLEAARQLSPQHAAVQGLLADAYGLMGRHDEATAARRVAAQLVAAEAPQP